MTKDKSFQFSVPMEVESIPLRQYQKYLALLDSLGVHDENYEHDHEYFSMKVLQIFLGLDKDQVLTLKASDVTFLTNHIINMVNLEEDTPLVTEFKMDTPKGTVEFGFEPKLDDMAFGALIDLDTYIRSDKDLHKMMAVLYRPIKERWKDTYTIYDYSGTEAWAEVMRDAPFAVAVSARLFFYRLWRDLPKAIATSSQVKQATQELVQNYRQVLEKSGDGISHYTNWLKAHLLILREQLNSPSIQQ